MRSFLQTQTSHVTERLTVLAAVSLLGDCPEDNRASSTIDGRNVLGETLTRVIDSGIADEVVVIAWDDQIEAAKSAADGLAIVESVGPRRPMPWMDATSAALRWTDGWRGGLLGTCEFDRGFDAGVLLRALAHHDGNAVLLVSPAAMFVEPSTLCALLERLAVDADQAYAFAVGPVGSVAMLLRRSQLEELERGRRGPGSLLAYHPDRPLHDPLAKAFAVAVPSQVARTLTRVAPDRARSARRLALVQHGDHESLESLVTALERDQSLDPLPREIVLDLTSRRATKPAWSMHATRSVEIDDLPIDAVRAIFAEIATVDCETRVTLAGIGDALLHPQFSSILDAARGAGLRSLHVETDLLPEDPAVIEQVAEADLDIVSFHLPAATRGTYQQIMGVDRIGEVIANVQRFLVARSRRASGVPILVPTFVKCIANFGEMEAWYDQWIRAMGSAVIAAPTDLAGSIPFVGIDDLTPPSRRPCRRLVNRITIRSDGSIVPCEEACSDHAVGRVGGTTLRSAWIEGLSMLRSLHDERRWHESELCRTCRMWDRP